MQELKELTKEIDELLILSQNTVRYISIIDYISTAGTVSQIKNAFNAVVSEIQANQSEPSYQEKLRFNPFLLRKKYGGFTYLPDVCVNEHQKVFGSGPWELSTKAVTGATIPRSHYTKQKIIPEEYTFNQLKPTGRIGFFKELLITFGRTYYHLE